MHNTEDLILKKADLQIYYDDWISDDNKNTILILHGWGGSSKSWLLVGELLFKNGFNVVIPDLPGFGNTKLDKVFDLDEYANVIEEFIKELGLKNIILWGHSNGGAISIRIANRHKINISRLVLNNSAGIRNDKKRNFKRKIIKLIIKPFISFKKAPGFLKIREFFYRLIGGQDYLNAEKKPFLKQTYINMIKSDLKNEINEITQDTLLIWGEKDTYTPLLDGMIMREKIKKSKIIILENEKHGIHLSNPEKLVNTFINNI